MPKHQSELLQEDVLPIIQAYSGFISTLKHSKQHEVVVFVYANNENLFDQIQNANKEVAHNVEYLSLNEARKILPNTTALDACNLANEMCFLLATELPNNKRMYYPQSCFVIA